MIDDYYSLARFLMTGLLLFFLFKLFDKIFGTKSKEKRSKEVIKTDKDFWKELGM